LLQHRLEDMARDTTALSDLSKMKNEADGHFRRPASTFRSFIEKNGQFPPEKDRYHLYISYGCPWANRTVIVRELKGLEDIIGLSVVGLMDKDGWAFAPVSKAFPEVTDDLINHAQHIKDLYLAVEPEYTGRFTVPVLWDKKTSTIVNNESSEIIRIFNSGFNEFLPEDKAKLDFYPENLRAEIDEINGWVYETVNNGVYKAGFATSQEAYNVAVTALFKSLDGLEKILEGKDYLVGSQLTEADIRLFTTIIRFDVGYHGAFKCNIGSIRHDYPNINSWVKKLYWLRSEFKDNTKFDHIKVGYYSLPKVNATGIVPLGPVPDIETL